MKNILAIIIPFYKIDFFEKTLQSISLQSDKRFTVYIGNDASPSDPCQLIKRLLNGVDYKYFPYTKNLGSSNLAKQWERILQNVDEPWFQVLGDDDYISENFVEEFYHHINRVQDSGSQVIRYNYIKIDENDTVIDHFFQNYETIRAVDFMRSKLNWEVGSSLSENIFKRTLFLKYGFEKFPLAWHSDDYALLRLSNFGTLYHIATACAYVRISSISITGSSHLEGEKAYASQLFIEKLLSDYKLIDHPIWFKELKNHYLFICKKNNVMPKFTSLHVFFYNSEPSFFIKYAKCILSVGFHNITRKKLRQA